MAVGARLRTYRAATYLLRPVAKALLAYRAAKGKEDVTRQPERMGHAARARPLGRLVWIHAASVGETNAILPLIGRLRERRPGLRFLLTTGTVTSAGLAARRLTADDIHQYVPLDVPQFVSRFLDHWRPDLAIFTESEIWPNLILESARRRIPLALVNARMSERSFQRWSGMADAASELFGRLDLVLAQNDRFAGWFERLGSPRSRAVGNLKIDAPPLPVDAAELGRLRGVLAGRPLLVAASTHDGEEQVIADAHRRLVRDLPGLCTAIAPRHPDRGAGVAADLDATGLTTRLRSAGAAPGPGCDIYIIDTIGELGTFYALAPVAFIGGTLIDRGGQNPIEAVRHGAVVLAGPHRDNFMDAFDTLARHEGAVEVRSADDVAHSAGRLLRDEPERERRRTGAETALAELSGALERTVSALLDYLPDGPGLKRAS